MLVKRGVDEDLKASEDVQGSTDILGDWPCGRGNLLLRLPELRVHHADLFSTVHSLGRWTYGNQQSFERHADRNL